MTQRPVRGVGNTVQWEPVILGLRAMVDTPAALGESAGAWRSATAGSHKLLRGLRNRKDHWSAQANGIITSC